MNKAIILIENEKINNSINALKQLAEELKRCPLVREYESLNHNGYSRRVLENKLKLNYNNICKKYLPEYKLNHETLDITLEDLYNDILEIKNKIGRLPLATELTKYNLPHFNTIKKNFNMTYNQIIESFGWEPIGTTTLKKSEDELLKDFYIYFKELKRVPTKKELNTNNKTATHSTYVKYFKSIENICALLNIDYNLYHKNNGMGKIYLDNNNKLCKSLPERDISNFFIVNNIYFEKEPSYSEIFENDKRQFDWKIYIGSKFYYVEYFGLYNKNPRGNIGKKYFKKTKKKIKDLYKAGLANQCVFIFPYDYNNKKLSDVFGFVRNDLIDIPFEPDAKYLEYDMLSDEEILNTIMIYSDDINILPSTSILVEQNVSLYNFIIKKYDSYFNFAELMNKQVINKPNNYWSENKVFEIFTYMINKYDRIITKRDIDIIKSDYLCKNIRTIQMQYGWINIKLKFFKYCVNIKQIIPEIELEWIGKIANNIGSGIKGKISKEQQDIAVYILNNY